MLDATNYSLAARKAWRRMPRRRVGRPKGTAKTDRVSVTLRIDRELWDHFRRAESAGLIQDRTALINSCIAQKLAEIDIQQSRRSAPNGRETNGAKLIHRMD